MHYADLVRGTKWNAFTRLMYVTDVCPELNVQMYADDAVIFIHGKNTEIISSCLSNASDKVQHWLNNISLQLNVNKIGQIEGSNGFLNGAEI